MLIVSGIACLIVGFILGYGVRASISRHRHKAARRRYDVSGSYRYIEPMTEHHNSRSTSLEHTILREKIPPNDRVATRTECLDAAHIEADVGNMYSAMLCLGCIKIWPRRVNLGKRRGMALMRPRSTENRLSRTSRPLS